MSKINYKVTKQYAKDDEIPLASFFDLNDAIFFLERKILDDSDKYITIIYRIFDDREVIKVYNKEKINGLIRYAKFASLDNDLPHSIGPFKISKDQLLTDVIATFADLNNAEFFIEEKLTHSNNELTYYIFNNDSLLTQMNKNIKTQTVQGDDKQGKGPSTVFRPTPFNIAPRPAGMPPIWLKDNNEEKDS
jgi:hypothetical protein